MSTIAGALAPFRAWTEPRVLREGGSPQACWFEQPAPPAEVESATQAARAAGTEVLGEAVELWSQCRTARLCEDVEAHQWGLVLLDPVRAEAVTAEERRDRPEDFRAEDLIIGEFLADLEFLVLTAPVPGQRDVLVSQPMEGREDWYTVADTLAEFLTRYYAELGDKWWEP